MDFLKGCLFGLVVITFIYVIFLISVVGEHENRIQKLERTYESAIHQR